MDGRVEHAGVTQLAFESGPSQPFDGVPYIQNEIKARLLSSCEAGTTEARDVRAVGQRAPPGLAAAHVKR